METPLREGRVSPVVVEDEGRARGALCDAGEDLLPKGDPAPRERIGPETSTGIEACAAEERGGRKQCPPSTLGGGGGSVRKRGAFDPTPGLEGRVARVLFAIR